MPRLHILSLAALLLCAGVFGLIWGLRAVPPGETEIINAVAAEYMAETGGDPSTCFARPSEAEGVRLVVICAADGADPWVRAVGPYGAPVRAALRSEPQT